VNPIPTDLSSLPPNDAVNVPPAWVRGGLMLEANAYAAADARIALPAIRSYVAGDKGKFGFSFKTNDSRPNTVQMFPEVKYGRKPWDDYRSTAALDLPKRLSELSKLAVNVVSRWELDGSGNAALDLWLMKSADAGPDGIVAEVMVWLDKKGSIRPAGVYVQGNDAYDFWMSPGFGEGPQWPYFAFVWKTPILSGYFDLKALLDFLVHRGSVAGDPHLICVEDGCEVIEGEGWRVWDQYEVLVG
jgi:hypothetical protein